MEFLDLTEDQLVERLAELQKLSRAVINTGQGVDGENYNKSKHEKAVTILFLALKLLAEQGDIV